MLKQLESLYQENEHSKIVKRIEQLSEEERTYDIMGHYARALNNLGRYEEALLHLMPFKKQGQFDADWHWRVGYAYFFMHKWQEAFTALEKVQTLKPDPYCEQFLIDCRNIMANEEKLRKEHERIPFRLRDFQQFWEKSNYATENYVEAAPTIELITSIEQELGYQLPADYIWLMQQQNGGLPINTCFPTAMPTSWAEDYVAINGIMGIGREKTYSLCGDLGSRFMLEEWGYPEIGVVIADCPSAGHDVIMLDYRFCGNEGEPAVVHVDQENDYQITYLAPSFSMFIVGLVNEEVFDTSEVNKQEDLDTVKNAPFSPLLQSLCENTGAYTQIEKYIRDVATQIVEEKGYFALHADKLSMLMYDLQFWLYTQKNTAVTEAHYLEVYQDIIALASGFSTGGYAPSFVTSWLKERINKKEIVCENGYIYFSSEKWKSLQKQLLKNSLSL